MNLDIMNNTPAMLLLAASAFVGAAAALSLLRKEYRHEYPAHEPRHAAQGPPTKELPVVVPEELPPVVRYPDPAPFQQFPKRRPGSFDYNYNPFADEAK